MAPFLGAGAGQAIEVSSYTSLCGGNPHRIAKKIAFPPIIRTLRSSLRYFHMNWRRGPQRRTYSASIPASASPLPRRWQGARA
jgi:hypothetical protein